jgi:hypothetical protein
MLLPHFNSDIFQILEEGCEQHFSFNDIFVPV